MTKEFNKDVKIKLKNSISNPENSYQYLNNPGRVNFDGNLKKISRYKFSKIDNFYQYEPEAIFHKAILYFLTTKEQF